MNIKSIGLLINGDTLELLEKELIEAFLNKEQDASIDEIETVLSKYNISFVNRQKQEIFSVIQQMCPTIIVGFKKLKDNYEYEDYEDGELISKGFTSYDEALLSLRGSESYFKEYPLIQIRSEVGDLRTTFNFDEYITLKSSLVISNIDKIKALTSVLSDTNKQIEKLTIVDNDPCDDFDENELRKSSLVNIFERGELIYNQETQNKIIELLKFDQKELNNAIKASQENPERLALVKKAEALNVAIEIIKNLIDNAVDFKTVLGLSTSNIDQKEIDVLLALEITRNNFMYQIYNSKYVMFAKKDIRDDLQANFKEACPQSKHNIKSRTMVEPFALTTFIMSLQLDNMDLLLNNIL